VLMVADGRLERQVAGKALCGGPWFRFGVLGPGEVHLREGAVVDAEDHLIAASALDHCRQLMPGELVIGANFRTGPGRSGSCDLHLPGTNDVAAVGVA
jgi:hypothetical protein